MNYYYDIKLNFQEDNYYFFDWLKEDKLVFIKKIPLIKVNREEFLKIYTHHISISPNFLKVIKDKTILQNNQTINAILICDKNNTLAILFDKSGKEIKRSSLDFKDEESICEIIYTAKKIDLQYNILNIITPKETLRIVDKIKSTIIKDIENLKRTNIDKLKYYYFEYFNEECDDLDIMTTKLKNEILKTNSNDYTKLKMYK